MQYEKFRRVLMVAALTGSALTVQTPAGAGDRTQYLPAALADSLKIAEQADQALPENERQRLYYKNGISSIGDEDYYAHTVKTPSGVLVTEYRLDAPVDTPAPAAAPAPAPFDQNAFAQMLGQALAAGLVLPQLQNQAIQPVQPAAPAPAPAPAGIEPSAATKAVEQAPAAQTADAQAAGTQSDAGIQPLTTAANNVAAGESAEGAVQAVGPDSSADTTNGVAGAVADATSTSSDGAASTNAAANGGTTSPPKTDAVGDAAASSARQTGTRTRRPAPGQSGQANG